MKRSTAARRGPTVEHIAYQRRDAGRWRTGSDASRRLSSSSATAWREMNATPRPARAACLMAPLDPSVSVCGSSPAAARNSSLTTRVPDPGSRSSQTRRSSSAASTAPPPVCGSSGEVMRTKSLGRIAVAWMRGSRGGRPPIATSARWSSTRSRTCSRFPTASVSPIASLVCEKARMSGGTNDSAAVVTAASRRRRSARCAASRAARRPSSSSPMTSAANGANAFPAAVGRIPRPSRSVTGVPSSRDSAATAAETEGWVTTSSSAAAVTEPPRMTARKLRSCVRVIDTRRTLLRKALKPYDSDRHPQWQPSRAGRQVSQTRRRDPSRALRARATTQRIFELRGVERLPPFPTADRGTSALFQRRGLPSRQRGRRVVLSRAEPMAREPGDRPRRSAGAHAMAGTGDVPACGERDDRRRAATKTLPARCVRGARTRNPGSCEVVSDRVGPTRVTCIANGLDLLTAPLVHEAVTQERAHRPWPLPARSWIMAQTWTDLLFAHWSVEPQALRDVVPPQLPLDTFDGKAYVGVTPFGVRNMRLRLSPAVPLLSAFAEINVRTYVTVDAKPGIYFFSLDAASRLAVATARRAYRLPY